jgi:hypothetical protein
VEGVIKAEGAIKAENKEKMAKAYKYFILEEKLTLGQTAQT